MSKSWKIAAAAAMVLMGSASASHAEELLFTYTGSFDATFQIDSAPTPSSTIAGISFTLDNVAGTFNGVATTFTDVSFFDASPFGGADSNLDLPISPANPYGAFAQSLGPQLFSGTDQSPIFAPGPYANLGGEGFAGVTPISGNENLTITAIASAAPEPSVWMLMLAGVGGLGLTLRRAKRRMATAVGAVVA